MSTCVVSNKVLTGMYAGFTRAEMKVEFQRYKTALQRSSSRLTGSTVNGQSFSFGPRSDMNLADWGKSVRNALAQVDPDFIAPSQAMAVRFGYTGS